MLRPGARRFRLLALPEEEKCAPISFDWTAYSALLRAKVILGAYISRIRSLEYHQS